MHKVRITLKGLKPNSDVYEESSHIIEASTEDELEANITSFIYEYRNKHQYYKIKYTKKEKL